MDDHPAVSKMGWDAVLSLLGMAIWAGSRGVDIKGMLEAVALWGRKVEEGAKAVGKTVEKAVTKAPKVVKGGRAGTRSRSKTRVTNENDEAEDDADYRAGKKAEVWAGDEEKKEDWESGALAWGLSVIGGLGYATAGVLGAELAA